MTDHIFITPITKKKAKRCSTQSIDRFSLQFSSTSVVPIYTIDLAAHIHIERTEKYNRVLPLPYNHLSLRSFRRGCLKANLGEKESIPRKQLEHIIAEREIEKAESDSLAAAYYEDYKR